MNKRLFKKEICSYCKHNRYCSKDKIEYIKEHNLKTLKCLFYNRKKSKECGTNND